MRNRVAATVVTGFYVPDADRPASETDGPPGGAYLAQALARCGVDVQLMSDGWSIELLRVAQRENNCGAELSIVEFPGAMADARVDPWVDRYLDSRSAKADSLLLVAVERAGPSHTPETATRGAADPAAARAAFERDVPAAHHDRCHNMRGRVVDAWTAPVHRLFERAAERGLPAHSIGIADGGNEIGCGALAWDVLRAAVGQPGIAATACRIACDDLILAGVSNWGAYALAEALLAAVGPNNSERTWPAARRYAEQRRLIERMAGAGAIDGVSRRPGATVDGLSLDEALAPLAEIQSLVRRNGD